MLMICLYKTAFSFKSSKPNGLRYPLVGGTRERHFDGTHFKPPKALENAQTPTSRVVSLRRTWQIDVG
jgi:hypothetical protein